MTLIPFITNSFLLVLLLADVASATSFDCTKATTAIEKKICGSTKLSVLDSRLGDIYIAALKKTSDVKALKQQQRDWLKTRNACKDNACLTEQYQQRIGDLALMAFSQTIHPVDISEFDIDCDNPQSDREKFICDESYSYFPNMRNELQWALMRNEDKQAIIESQRRWQEEVLDQCEEKDEAGYCLRQLALKPRTEELRALQARPQGCYVLRPTEDRDGYVEPISPVCQAMEINLNSYCNEPPMVCDLKILPEFQKLITFPHWTPLDPEANRKLIENFLQAPWDYDEEIWALDKPGVDAAFAANTITFSKGFFDLFNLGEKQTTYRLEYATCQEDNPQLGGNIWNLPLSPARVISQHSPEALRAILENHDYFGASDSGEVFFFGGKTYYYWMGGYWLDNGEVENQLHVREIKKRNHGVSKGLNPSLMRNEVCTFFYEPGGKAK